MSCASTSPPLFLASILTTSLKIVNISFFPPFDTEDSLPVYSHGSIDMLICDPLDSDLEEYFQVDTHIIPPYIPSTIALNNPKTIQIPSSLADSSLVSYAVIFILYDLKYFLIFSGWLSMNLVIYGQILNMFGYFLNTYSSDLIPIHHSDFYTYQFSPVVHNFPILALYPRGATKSFVFAVPYANVSDISEFYQPHIISRKVLHHIGILTCDSHHNFAAIKGIDW